MLDTAKIGGEFVSLVHEPQVLVVAAVRSSAAGCRPVFEAAVESRKDPPSPRSAQKRQNDEQRERDQVLVQVKHVDHRRVASPRARWESAGRSRQLHSSRSQDLHPRRGAATSAGGRCRTVSSPRAEEVFEGEPPEARGVEHTKNLGDTRA